MKVYINKRTGGYGVGLIIVAANSHEEAHGTMYRDLKYGQDYYEFQNWEELQGVSYAGDKPKLLAEDGYSE